MFDFDITSTIRCQQCSGYGYVIAYTNEYGEHDDSPADWYFDDIGVNTNVRRIECYACHGVGLMDIMTT